MPSDEKLNEIIKKFPNNEELIEFLKEVKFYCKNTALENCKECKFYVDRYIDEHGRECGHCQFIYIASKLLRDPADWNMGSIERVIRL